MSCHRLALVALILVGLTAAGTSAGEPSIAPEAGLLVLRNGRILEGRIIRVGDRFRVALGAEDEVSLPASHVEFHCRDLREAYQLKRAASRPERIQEVLDLADWCLQHDLFREAAEQLLNAHGLDPATPRLRVLERRLHVALDDPDQEEEIPRLTMPRPTVTVEDVQQALEGLPRGSVEWYTSRVQPLLLNRCATGRCHGARSTSGLRLAQPSQGQRLTTKITHRNLFHTLQHVDRDNPEASRLLRAIEAPHADLSGPVFEEHEAEMERLLRDWVHHLARPARRESPGRLAKTHPVLLQPTGPRRSLRVPFADPARDPELPIADRAQPPVASSSPDSRRPPPVTRAGYEAADDGSRQAVIPAQAMTPVAGSPAAGASDHPSGDQPSGDHPSGGQPSGDQPSGGQPSGDQPSGGNRAASSPFRPRDPFDPEIFNRRYLPDARR